MTDDGVLGVGAIAEAIVTGACSADRPPTVRRSLDDVLERLLAPLP